MTNFLPLSGKADAETLPVERWAKDELLPIEQLS